jgi:hypothetical protein
MFQHIKKNESSSSAAGPTPFHRRVSYIVPYNRKHRRFQWLIYDNDGSFNGWFDWLPVYLRVGYWSPIIILALIICYTSIVVFKPTPLEFVPFVLSSFKKEQTTVPLFMGMTKSTAIDLFIFTWGILVVIIAKMKLGSIGAFPMSFTGWSWILLTARAGFEFMAWTAYVHKYTLLATTFATMGSSIRLVTISNACVVFTIWNFILFPLIYYKSTPEGDKRRAFLRFNFGFFMTNIHLLNFPLSCLNIIYGEKSRLRLFNISDLWLAYAVVLFYSMLYYFVMDRLGLHFYPIFNPRTSLSLFSIVGVLGLYYFMFLKWNEYIGL